MRRNLNHPNTVGLEPPLRKPSASAATNSRARRMSDEPYRPGSAGGDSIISNATRGVTMARPAKGGASRRS